MNVTHANVVFEARTLITDILSTSTDSVEKSLSRTGNRVVGALVGLFIMGMPAGVCFADAVTDGEKLQKVRAKLIDLATLELDKASPDYEKAIAARDFQKDVYDNVAKYTLTAQRVKNIAGVGSVVLALGSTFASVGSEISPNLHLAARIAINTGLLIALPSAAYGIYHKLSEGAQLGSANKALANQALTQLSA